MIQALFVLPWVGVWLQSSWVQLNVCYCLSMYVPVWVPVCLASPTRGTCADPTSHQAWCFCGSIGRPLTLPVLQRLSDGEAVPSGQLAPQKLPRRQRPTSAEAAPAVQDSKAANAHRAAEWKGRWLQLRIACVASPDSLRLRGLHAPLHSIAPPCRVGPKILRVFQRVLRILVPRQAALPSVI